jgi:pimeloyl-ACP methyl ester carboxylesterase
MRAQPGRTLPRDKVDVGRLVYFGESLGAAVAVELALEHAARRAGPAHRVRSRTPWLHIMSHAGSAHELPCPAAFRPVWRSLPVEFQATLSAGVLFNPAATWPIKVPKGMSRAS